MKPEIIINNGIFELIPKSKEYDNFFEFLKDYNVETPNSEGVRYSNYKERNYLIREYNKLGVFEHIKKYGYSFVTEIIINYDPFGNGFYREAIIDDPEEVVKFQNGEGAFGYDSDGGEEEFWKGAGKIEDWTEETNTFFLVRDI